MLHLKTRDSEAIGESEQVLEISKPARSGRREMLADIVLSNELAEAVAEIQMACEPDIHANMRSKNRPSG